MSKPKTELVKCRSLKDKPYTTSKIIADEFGKLHLHVMESVRKILKDHKEFGESNFRLSSYISKQNKVLPCYKITELGCQLIVLGYNTKKAQQVKIAFLKEFHAMRNWIEESIQSGSANFEEWKARRYQIATDYKHVHEALKRVRLDEGKETKNHHYSNESNMINRIILGVDAKKYKELEQVGNVRDSLTSAQLEAFEALQLADTNLLDMGITNYKNRKHKLEVLFANKFNHLVPLQLNYKGQGCKGKYDDH